MEYSSSELDCGTVTQTLPLDATATLFGPGPVGKMFIVLPALSTTFTELEPESTTNTSNCGPVVVEEAVVVVVVEVVVVVSTIVVLGVIVEVVIGAMVVVAVA